MGVSTPGLRVTLVGSPRLQWQNFTEVEPPTRKGLALVAYLLAFDSEWAQLSDPVDGVA